jgi:drug/metabolite transporter (DMT)-like permease
VLFRSSFLAPKLAAFLVSLGSSICLLCYVLLKKEFMFPKYDILIYVIAKAIICTALPVLFFLEGMKYISSSKASILSVLEPIFVAIFGVILLNEQMSFRQVLGVLVVLSTIIIIQKSE